MGATENLPGHNEPGMNPSLLELRRARKRLEAFCRERNYSGRAGPTWCLSQNDTAFVISERTPGCAEHEAVPVLRLCFDDGRWFLSVPTAAGRWRAYPPRPEADSIDVVIEDLEQAPLHVHWG